MKPQNGSRQPRRQAGRADRLSAYFRAELPALSIVTVSGIIYNVGLAVCPRLEGELVQTLADILGGSAAAGSILAPVLVYLCAVLCVQAMRAVKRLFVRKFANNTGLRLKKILYGSLLHPETRAELGAGDAMSRAIGDAEACAEGMRKVTTEIFDTGVALLAYCVLLFTYDPALAAICIIFPPLAAYCAEKMKKPVTEAASAMRKSAAALSDATLDRVGNAVTYRVTGLEELRDEKYEETLRDYEKKSIRSGLFAAGMWPVYNAIALCGVIFVIWLGGRNTLGTGWREWDLAAFTAFFSCYCKLAVKASKTSKLFNAIQKAGVSWKRIQPLLCELPDDPDPAPASAGPLRIENLSVSYLGRGTVFSGLSFEIQPGQIYGVTGEVACGKSALGRAFLGEEPHEGNITLGGKPLPKLGEDPAHRYVAYLGHSPELFDGTGEDNILLGTDADAAVFARLACIAEEFEAFPEKYETRLGEKGVRLSGGQQARTALARTLCHPAPVYVLDDPFSAVDLQTEEKIFENLRTYCKDSAVLLISHRLSLFDRLDGVIFMENGRCAVGSHTELLRTEPGYARLYEAQTGAQNTAVPGKEAQS